MQLKRNDYGRANQSLIGESGGVVGLGRDISKILEELSIFDSLLSSRLALPYPYLIPASYLPNGMKRREMLPKERGRRCEIEDGESAGMGND